jgi:pimeloyl-[acyl-carrier protein] methyl ester esterase
MKLHLTKIGQGKPLVLFHGWGFDSGVWSVLVPRLEDTYRIFSVDLPGFGLSPLMDWPTFKTQLLEEVTQPFHLAGWSLGGLYATRLAHEAPNSVRSLINIASSPCFLAKEHWPGLSKEVIETFHLKLSLNAQETLNDFVALQTKGLSVRPKMHQQPSERALEHGLEALSTWDLRDCLQALKIPVTYFFGRLDSIISIKTMHTLQKHYPHVRCELFKHSAHMPFLSHPEDFLARFKSALDNAPRCSALCATMVQNETKELL